MANMRFAFSRPHRGFSANMRRRTGLLVPIVLLVVLFTARTTRPPQVNVARLVPISVDAESELPIHRRSDYVIGPPDLLTIEVRADGIDGELLSGIYDRCLVSPDGTVDLGDKLGKFYAAGLTTTKVKSRIEAGLQSGFPNTADIQCHVAVYRGNSKVYYVIAENRLGGDQVYRLPISVHDTVRRTLTEMTSLSNLGSKNLWIARPAPGGVGTDQILRIDWRSVATDPSSPTNYAVLPGDRIFIHEPPGIWDLLNAVIAGFSNPDAPPL